MCGIVGLYLKNPSLSTKLGALFEPMLVAMSGRGPDSAGYALYHDGGMTINKATGLPEQVAKQFDLKAAQGSHIIGHTRMATESAVSAAGSHPFSAGMDVCLVHNGSFSNHNRLRETLRREGIDFETDNDTEVAAGYLTWRLREGDDLKTALYSALDVLDGFYTLTIGTSDGFAVLRDPIACKPAVLAETDDYVAMASEYQALAHLPGIEQAKLWEPEPATVYVWTQAAGQQQNHPHSPLSVASSVDSRGTSVDSRGTSVDSRGTSVDSRGASL